MKRLHEELMMEAERKKKLLQEALSIHTFLNEVRVLRLDACAVVFQFLRRVCVCLGVGAGGVFGGAASRVGISGLWEE